MNPQVQFQFEGKIAKEGNSPEECEDQCAVFEDKSRFALADGASEASYSGIWADILVQEFGDLNHCDMHEDGIVAWLDVCRSKWNMRERQLREKELPWFAREKLSHGSFSTFLGISFDLAAVPYGQLIWRAAAYGDSCLFVIREDWLALSFPLEKAEDFNNTPPLLRTSCSPQAPDWRLRSGSLSEGDYVFLATDALAQWFLSAVESNDKPWRRLATITSREEFSTFVSDCRSAHLIRNDDVALIRLQCAALQRGE